MLPCLKGTSCGLWVRVKPTRANRKLNAERMENVISDGWVTKERISQKLLFWWHDWEVLVYSRESFEYLMF